MIGGGAAGSAGGAAGGDGGGGVSSVGSSGGVGVVVEGRGCVVLCCVWVHCVCVSGSCIYRSKCAGQVFLVVS